MSKQSFLNENLALEAILKQGDLDEPKAKFHLKQVIHKLFVHERNTVHKKLLQDVKDGLRTSENPLKATENMEELEFDLNGIPNVPKSLRRALCGWSTLTSKVVVVQESSDFVTTKLLIELQTGHRVESVILRHSKRTTLCVSSQVGCKMGCTFCATGTLGQRANLTSGEIQEQIIHANRFLKLTKEPRDISNIVFMGMGEPLNNYSNVVAAVRALTDPGRFALAPGKITISTVGVTNRMKTLADDLPGVSLALSLHAPNQELRLKIIPTAGAYPLDKLIQALETHLNSPSAIEHEQYVMIEYILLSGVNDTVPLAHELASILERIKDRVKINLIPYNPIFNPEGLAKTFVPPPPRDVERFRSALQFDHGLFCTVRTEMGQDVNGACGQLACITEQKADIDIEDLYKSRKQNALYDHESGQNVRKESRTKRRTKKNMRPSEILLEKLFNLPSIATKRLKDDKLSLSFIVVGASALALVGMFKLLPGAGRHNLLGDR